MPDWGFQVLSVLTALAALALLYWAIFRDRSRGRRRCPKCWYDLRGSDSLTCSECGYTAKRQRQFFRTRRRWRWVVVVVVIGVGARVLWLVPKAQREGWLAAAPTTIVISAIPYYGRDAIDELYSRRIFAPRKPAIERLLWNWQRSYAMWQASHMLGADQGRATRVEMLDFILELDEDAAVGDTLLHWMSDPDPAIRQHGAWYSVGTNLNPIGPDVIRSRLIELMGDASARVQAGAARGLSRFAAGDRAILELMLAGLDDADGGVRAECAWGVSRFGGPAPEALPRLTELILSRDAAAAAAAETLGVIGDQSVLPSLLDGLESSEFWLRWRCAMALIALAPGSAIAAPALIDLTTSHSQPEVRGAAIATLVKVAPTRLNEVNWQKLIENADTAMEALRTLEHEGDCDEDAIVPILVAIAESCPAALSAQNESDSAYHAAISMMQRYSERGEQMVPVLVTLLERDQPYIRQASIETLGSFGRTAQTALSALETMLRECRNPHEQGLLKNAIQAIKKGSADK